MRDQWLHRFCVFLSLIDVGFISEQGVVAGELMSDVVESSWWQ